MKWLCMFLCLPSFSYAECLGTVLFEELSFEVEIMADMASRAQGLMFREELDDDHGMLFAYENDGKQAFWMKNTRLPLDIVFYKSTGAFNNVQRNARPFDLTPLPGFGSLVLEVNAGLYAKNAEAMSEVIAFLIDETNKAHCPDWLLEHALRAIPATYAQ